MRNGTRAGPLLPERARSEGDGEAAGMDSVLAEPPRWSSGRSMRAVETTPAASLNAGEELSPASFDGRSETSTGAIPGERTRASLREGGKTR